MNITTEVTGIPHTLWTYYLDYLWFYAPDSYVAKTANAAFLLAILVSLPVVVLGLLDIASYGIARTLGVIDDVKASTSDKATVHATVPAIRVERAASSDSDSLFSDSDRDARSPAGAAPPARGAHPLAAQPSLFYVGEDTSLQLSGVDVFSPAASQPPSPTISRHSLAGAAPPDTNSEQLRHRPQHANGGTTE